MKRMDAVIYIHGKGGNAAEAEHYNLLFSSCHVIGLEYKSFTPWEAGMEIHAAVAELNAEYDRIILIANSIGAYFSMNADIERYVTHAFFISPIVDMEKLISDMMGWLASQSRSYRKMELFTQILVKTCHGSTFPM